MPKICLAHIAGRYLAEKLEAVKGPMAEFPGHPVRAVKTEALRSTAVGRNQNGALYTRSAKV